MPPDELARRSTLSRRGALKGGGAVAFAGVSLAALKLPFFSVDGAAQNPMTCRAADVSAREREFVISNWTGYIDPRKQPTSTMAEFQAKTGITVDYNVDVNDNAEFYAKVKNQLGSCDPIDRDMIVLTDWMAARMIGLGWIQPMDKAAVPNLHANIIDSLRDKQWDPDLEYHAPWQSGLTGIAYNAAEVGEVGSFEELISRSDLNGKITLLSEMRDTMGFMLKVVGADPTDFTEDQWQNALDRLKKAIADGQLRSFAGNNYLQELSGGNVLACEAWSGDVIQAQFENPDIKFVVPEEGLSLWSDNMMIPNQATHQANAQQWIDYYYDPVVAAKLAAWVNYICPVAGAREEMEKLDPSLVDNPLIFPDDDFLANTFDFMPLDDRQNAQYEKEWADVTAG
ncbi:ABC transporter substrate-binding protein [Nocardioides psychrotolerans]|uniref:Spermidine/putrescine transport system substrate-binding protein n=1 Tax=Nocardioides psychrotolerans TaxID=1005945 RepID=A0A1I3CZ93_9ACTN|nr:spermidine/putrescine ABC transporter substrate-binding protein [Nocardioides psychrotolerans]GEP36965.1 ABC transporter substrate-binding protein [Nocardioides psychrotolerans]SFH79706.1 spermidine/putrescine transport system substrate-binding protein [Nocardioides psychrotolerans]